MSGYRSKRAQRWGDVNAVSPQKRYEIAQARVRAREDAEWVPKHDDIFQPWLLTLHLDSADLWDPELSNTLGVEVGVVDAWEEGLAVPTIEQVRVLSQMLGVRPVWFYPRGDDAKPPGLGGSMWVSHIGRVDDPHVPVDAYRWKHARPRPDLKAWKKTRRAAVDPDQLTLI